MLYARTKLHSKLQHDTVTLQKYQQFTIFFQMEPFAYRMFSVLLSLFQCIFLHGSSYADRSWFGKSQVFYKQVHWVHYLRLLWLW